MENFKIVAYLLLGCTDSGGYVKFTQKYIIVGAEEGVSDFFLRFQSYSFGNLSPSGLILVSEEDEQELSIIKASLASLRFQLGAVAKADQKGLRRMFKQSPITLRKAKNKKLGCFRNIFIRYSEPYKIHSIKYLSSW
jgi:hypothetical protein